MKKDGYLKWELHLLSLMFFLVKTIQGAMDDSLDFIERLNFISIFKKGKRVIKLRVVNYEYQGNYDDRYG